MIANIAQRSRWALSLSLVCLVVPATNAQPVLWGSAPADATFPNGRLVRIDYASGVVQATFNGPTGVQIGDGFTGIAVRPSNGQVFVTDGAGSNRVYRIDPATGTALSFFPSPTGSDSLDGLEFLDNVLYARLIAASAIVRINPDTGALIDQLPSTLPVGPQGGLTIADGVLFTNGSTGNTSIARRNLATGALLGEFATPNNEVIRGLATDGDSLYAASSTGFIYRLNPVNGAVLDSRNIGISLDGLGGPIPVPEPSAGLLVLGSALVVAVRRRPRARRSS